MRTRATMTLANGVGLCGNVNVPAPVEEASNQRRKWRAADAKCQCLVLIAMRNLLPGLSFLSQGN